MHNLGFLRPSWPSPDATSPEDTRGGGRIKEMQQRTCLVPGGRSSSLEAALPSINRSLQRPECVC
jgi:hypothetical protein